jgi:signal transduction histidine kinase
MSHSNLTLVLVGLRLIVVVGFLSAFGFVSGAWAQPVMSSERPFLFASPITNLLQLTKTLDSFPRTTADIRLDVIVCSASRPEIGVVAVKDKTGCEILELGSRLAAIATGDIIRLEGHDCLLRKREIGIEITSAPALDNDGAHELRAVIARVRLAAGFRPFQLDCFRFSDSYAPKGLKLSCTLPDGSVEQCEQFLVRPGGPHEDGSNMVAGLNANYYEGGWLNIPDFALLQPVKMLTTTNLDTIPRMQNAPFGVRFKGFFSAPIDGEYTFSLESGDGSMLFLGVPEVPVTTIGHEEIPVPAVSSLHVPITVSDAPKWMSVEGRVVFASKYGRGLRFELESQPDSIWVAVADGGEVNPVHFLNSRIRVTGIGRGVMAPDRNLVLGELSVATSDDITVLKDLAGTKADSGTAHTLLSAGQVQSLSKEEAARHLPVRIQGVVTSVAPSIFGFMSVQDETRGTFVRLASSVKATVAVGQFCQVVGHTDTGDFAPIVVAEDVMILGKGKMPPPARPTWKELINGSMDVQWVEFQGLVTDVYSNSLALFLPEGELDVEVRDYSESQLRAFQGAVVRLRGVLFAGWNTNRTVQIGHLLMRNGNIDVDFPAPRDPFDVPLKSWRELYQFDPRATPFQLVKVRGTVIYADSSRVFVMDKVRGIRVSTAQATAVRFGEVVEAVGYPDIGGPAPLLRKAILRQTGQTAEPVPLILDGGDLMEANVDSMLVRISATLMGMHSEPDSRVLEMNASGHLFLARLPDTKDPISLRIGSQLALTGVYVGKALTGAEGGKPSGFELLLSSPSQMTVLSQPSWWTPRRLFVIVGLLLVIIVLAAVWISQLRRLVEQRTRQLQRETREREVAERERALETERSRIARDLHDDLGSRLTEISVLARKGQRTGTLDDLTILFRAIAIRARGLVAALDIIVWAVDPKDNSLESVADYLGDFASEYLSHSGIKCRFDIPVALPPIMLEGRLRHGLLLAVKETLNNVERHAQATEVEFRMTFAGDQLEFVISDNGKGFDTKVKHGGHGLKNLPLRLSKLGGRYGIESTLGKGTIVTIGLRLLPRPETIPASRKS